MYLHPVQKYIKRNLIENSSFQYETFMEREEED
jgi:hypothetical protein